MPNGISCAYFAGKNLIYGQKEKMSLKKELQEFKLQGQLIVLPKQVF